MYLLLISFFCVTRVHTYSRKSSHWVVNSAASYLGNPMFNFGSSVPVLRFFWLFLPHPSRFILYWQPIRFKVTSAVETLTSSKMRHHARMNTLEFVLVCYCSCLFQNKAIGGSGIWPHAGSWGPRQSTARRWFALAMASRSAGTQGSWGDSTPWLVSVNPMQSRFGC